MELARRGPLIPPHSTLQRQNLKLKDMPPSHSQWIAEPSFKNTDCLTSSPGLFKLDYIQQIFLNICSPKIYLAQHCVIVEKFESLTNWLVAVLCEPDVNAHFLYLEKIVEIIFFKPGPLSTALLSLFLSFWEMVVL